MRSLVLLLGLLFAIALYGVPSATADLVAAPAYEWGVNGAGLPAVFAKYARVERNTYSYTAPGGAQSQAFEGNQSYWVSVKDRTTWNGETWYRTAANRWVRASDVRFFQSADFRGAYWNGLYDDGAKPTQFGFVLDYDTPVLYTPSANTPEHRYVQKYMWLPLNRIQNGFWDIGYGEWVDSDFVRPVRQAARPQGISASAKWIDVDLTNQTVAAYEGDKMVFATLTSTGKKTTPTITGLYYIYEKDVTHTMAGKSETGLYYLEEVPWSMYFTQRYALHGAYWHDGFGAIRSAGCVNLSPVDAQWLFSWSGPTVPAGANQVFSSDENPGTWVNVHY